MDAFTELLDIPRRVLVDMTDGLFLLTDKSVTLADTTIH